MHLAGPTIAERAVSRCHLGEHPMSPRHGRPRPLRHTPKGRWARAAPSALLGAVKCPLGAHKAATGRTGGRKSLSTKFVDLNRRFLELPAYGSYILLSVARRRRPDGGHASSAASGRVSGVCDADQLRADDERRHWVGGHGVQQRHGADAAPGRLERGAVGHTLQSVLRGVAHLLAHKSQLFDGSHPLARLHLHRGVSGAECDRDPSHVAG